MENNTQQPRKVIRVSKNKIIGLIIGLIVIFILFFVYAQLGGLRNARINTMGGEYNGVTSNSGSNSIRDFTLPEASSPSSNSFMDRMMPPFYYGGEPSIKDTREFLKTSYNAQIKTRDVSRVISDTKNAIRDVEGRIDSLNSSEKSGYISFVVPKSKFSEFQNTMESLTHKKLYVENISSQNLLSEKQSIEEQTTNATSTREKLLKDKAAIDAWYTKKIADLKKELTATQTQLASVRALIAKTTNETELVSLRQQETSLVFQEADNKKDQTSDTAYHVSQLASINAQIANIDQTIVAIGKQDTKFTDNIETVTGSVNIQWITLCALFKIFSPIPPSIIILIVIAILGYWFIRKGPKIEFV